MFVRKNHGPIFRLASIVLVSLYLIVVYGWLRLRGRLRPEFPLFRLFTAGLRRRYRGALEHITPEMGCCFTAAVPEHLVSDKDGMSRLRIFEDGFPLHRGSADHTLIRKEGRGAFSHWGRFVYFSSTDNTDPRVNGRRYVVGEV
jgi:hypothetical protein